MKSLNLDDKNAENTLLDNDLPDADDRNAENIQLDFDVACYVEGIEDVHFWKDIFDTFKPELKIIFYPHSRGLKSGKTNVLTEHNIKNACPSLILCVDSDLEYLLKNEPLFSHPYIFHTYSYSIENYKISPYALERIVEKSSYPLERIVEKSSYPDADINRFSFINFMQEYSKATYQLLRYILYFEKRKFEHGIAEPLLGEKKLKAIFCIQSDKITTINDLTGVIIKQLKKSICNLIEEINKNNTDIDLSQIDNYLSELKITEEDTYWYLNGHIMYDCVAKIIMGKVISNYRKEKREWFIKEKIKWFESQEKTKILEEKRNEYNNHIKNIDWKTLMNDGHTYCLMSLNRCPPIQKLREKIINANLKIFDNN
ncbi:MAG: DUF4435 domain-containing protein [Thiomargarita sp.]|nr:DUF4435 domain-containing protein [Thiomargarita sp.]